MKSAFLQRLIFIVSVLFLSLPALAVSDALKEGVFQVEDLKPRDSTLKVKVGDRAPDFTLKAVSGGTISLKDYIGKSNVMVSFVPAAWTPVCSDQWPGYNIAQEEFAQYDTILIGITVDNTPTQYAWTKTMGTLWFPVLSDFWPHGKVADTYGVLRSDGMTERAIFIIDKKGIIRYIDVHDINKRPPLEDIINALKNL